MGEVIDLLLSDSDNECDKENTNDSKLLKISNVDSGNRSDREAVDYNLSAYKKIQNGTATLGKKTKTITNSKSRTKTTTSLGLQAGLVLEEDIFAADRNDNESSDRKVAPNVLFEDPEFGPVASSIQGMHKASIADAAGGSNENQSLQKWRPKCRCKLLSNLSYNKDGRPYFSCGKNSAMNQTAKGRRCNFFSWAFQAELIPWYRFGSHNDHVLVRKDGFGAIYDTEIFVEPSSSSSIFSAQDLVQGKVGDCWFLSALAVVAERSDLVGRLFQRKPGRLQNQREDEQRGIVRVNLFLDGIWTPVTIDNFLPCFPGNSKNEEEELQKAIEASLLDQSESATSSVRNPYAKREKAQKKLICNTKFPPSASGNEPHGLSETNLRAMRAACSFLEKDCARRRLRGSFHGPKFLSEGHHASTGDLAYSKARRNQLWVPFLEKAYAKIHGSYQAISGGHVAEAFLDLTGAPTLQVVWHAGRAAEAGSSSVYNDPRNLWEDMKSWRRKKLPMGCGTDRSAGGLIGMHAYSILDVRELSNVDVEFFRERLLNGTLGNVSGFTEYDGKLRLIRVRNPHGQGEWKGEFSDKCKIWQKLLASSGITLPRTMANDGTFWIGYDDFLLGFSNIDVVLAFEGNHAKSFVSNFPLKKSNHRCQRAFEVSLLDPQPGLETKDRVEVYVMGIQKSKRGARQGRADRKKSYKVSDFGILVGEYPLDESVEIDSDDNNSPTFSFSAIHGQMFGFNRNGHYKLVLDRRRCKRLVVMPISFGHPAATDEFRTFVVRFNADAPLMIRELETTPRMDHVLGNFLMAPRSSRYFANTRQGIQTVLWKNSKHKVVQIECLGNGGGTVFVYLCALPDTRIHNSKIGGSASDPPITLGIEATCRGMSCRVAEGLLNYETTAKGKKFQASWRKYSTSFVIDTKSKNQSRLLMALYQSGQDTEMGSINCKSTGNVLGSREGNAKTSMTSTTLDRFWNTKESVNRDRDYKELGVFNSIVMNSDDFRKIVSFSSDVCVGYHRTLDFHKQLEDKELEKAIALSRSDPAIVLNGEVLNEDALLKEGLELSSKEAQNNRLDASRDSNLYNQELTDALQRSYQEAMAATSEHEGDMVTLGNKVIDLDDGEEDRESSAATPACPDVQPTIDLTGDGAVPVNACNSRSGKTNKNEGEVIVLDLTDSHAGSEPGNDKFKTKNSTVLDLLDSSEEEDEDEESRSFEAKNSNKRTIGNGNDIREKKRKLAADAALKRMKKK